MLVAMLAALLLFFWKWMPQEMPTPALPIVLLIVIKGMWRHYWKKEKEMSNVQ
jgi:MFS superfamily sulfate permease-like transporter